LTLRPLFSTATFADDHLTDALKSLASDHSVDPKVRRKLLLILLSWKNQFKDDPKMSLVAGLYHQARPPGGNKDKREREVDDLFKNSGMVEGKAKEKESKKKPEGERLVKAQDKSQKRKRPPFNFEKVRARATWSSARYISRSILRCTGKTSGLDQHRQRSASHK
jgi:hypothetical protein